MKVKKDFGCILCPYKKDKDCLQKSYTKCYSLSNIYWRTVAKRSPFKQIEWIKDKINEWKESNNTTKENDSLRFIWGYPNSDSACFYSLNDIDIVYDKHNRKYLLGIETAFIFDSKDAEIRYLKQLFSAFTQFMKDNNINTDYVEPLFMSNPHFSCEAETLEELYYNFKIYVYGREKILSIASCSKEN